MPRKLRLMLLALALTSTAIPAEADTLFDDLGGRSGIDRLVAQAMDIFTSDKRIASTFEESNLARVKQMLVEQICAISGGGCRYSGHSMAEAHRGLHLATVQFNALAEDLQAAMDKQNIPFSTQNRLMALLAPMHREIVTR